MKIQILVTRSMVLWFICKIPLQGCTVSSNVQFLLVYLNNNVCLLLCCINAKSSSKNKNKRERERDYCIRGKGVWQQTRNKKGNYSTNNCLISLIKIQFPFINHIFKFLERVDSISLLTWNMQTWCTRFSCICSKSCVCDIICGCSTTLSCNFWSSSSNRSSKEQTRKEL